MHTSWFHVANRSPEKVLGSSGAKDRFVERLGLIATGVEIHAYCVMETHYHLLVRADEVSLTRALAEVESGMRLTAEARRRRMAVGRHLLQVSCYIHRNPVEAGLVRDPAAWPWSSYRAYLDPLDGPPWLRSSTILGWLGSIGARQKYRQYVLEQR